MDQDAVFRALADPNRRALLDRLHARNGQTLGELCADQDVTRQAVTKHLDVLEAADLVVVVWSGREKLHYLNPVPIHEIATRWIGKYDQRQVSALAELKRGLEENPDEEARLRVRQLHRRNARAHLGGHAGAEVHGEVLGVRL